MRGWPKWFWSTEKSYPALASANRGAIEEYNGKILSVLLLTGTLLMLLPMLAVPFSPSKAAAVPAYVATISFYLLLFLVFRLPALKRFLVAGLYITFSVFFSLAVYLSIFHTPDMRATILLAVFCIMPLSFIDRPGRMNLFVLSWFILHTALAFHFKPRYALDDTINSLCFLILGGYLGNIMVGIRLESYEAHRLLIIEKETDVLTGLYNRRKLFETLEGLRQKGAVKPSGILMKRYRPFQAVQRHLRAPCCRQAPDRFGAMLLGSSEALRLQSYRYGGEEFTVLAYRYSESELYVMAESLRAAIETETLMASVSQAASVQPAVLRVHWTARRS